MRSQHQKTLHIILCREITFGVFPVMCCVTNYNLQFLLSLKNGILFSYNEIRGKVEEKFLEWSL